MNASLKRRLATVRKRSENQFCNECGTRDTTWALLAKVAAVLPSTATTTTTTTQLGALVCYQCCSALRSLGTHICVVKSIHLDSWNDEQVTAMEVCGNDILNGIWEAFLFDESYSLRLKSVGTSSNAMNTISPTDRLEFARRKYHLKEYCNAQALREFLIKLETKDDELDAMLLQRTSQRLSLHGNGNSNSNDSGASLISSCDLSFNTDPSNTIDASTSVSVSMSVAEPPSVKTSRAIHHRPLSYEDLFRSNHSHDSDSDSDDSSDGSNSGSSDSSSSSSSDDSSNAEHSEDDPWATEETEQDMLVAASKSQRKMRQSWSHPAPPAITIATGEVTAPSSQLSPITETARRKSSSAARRHSNRSSKDTSTLSSPAIVIPQTQKETVEDFQNSFTSLDIMSFHDKQHNHKQNQTQKKQPQLTASVEEVADQDVNFTEGWEDFDIIFQAKADGETVDEGRASNITATSSTPRRSSSSKEQQQHKQHRRHRRPSDTKTEQQEQPKSSSRSSSSRRRSDSMATPPSSSSSSRRRGIRRYSSAPTAQHQSKETATGTQLLVTPATTSSSSSSRKLRRRSHDRVKLVSTPTHGTTASTSTRTSLSSFFSKHSFEEDEDEWHGKDKDDVDVAVVVAPACTQNYPTFPYPGQDEDHIDDALAAPLTPTSKKRISIKRQPMAKVYARRISKNKTRMAPSDEAHDPFEKPSSSKSFSLSHFLSDDAIEQRIPKLSSNVDPLDAGHHKEMAPRKSKNESLLLESNKNSSSKPPPKQKVRRHRSTSLLRAPQTPGGCNSHESGAHPTPSKPSSSRRLARSKITRRSEEDERDDRKNGCSVSTPETPTLTTPGGFSTPATGSSRGSRRRLRNSSTKADPSPRGVADLF